MNRPTNRLSNDEPSVMIDAAFVRNQIRKAVRQYFLPITATFESARDGAVSAPPGDSVQIPKPERRDMRGYSLRRKS